ncbi:hypothetical protein SCOCK_760004 [Actinacidiphila cocklensis]|uniref:Uncharacterized protein n=1 Tax=Actinacidiphila cocklensis TaxID=887465 RepID=A0A9W4DZA8_9ACTN|nr:hypothetical protein SCOCK_760004 [Actinacidiphila cocklensis]
MPWGLIPRNWADASSPPARQRDRPPSRPAVAQIQTGSACVDVRRHEKVFPAALMRPDGLGVSGFD